MNPNAPYTGGYAPGAYQFAVDGNFYSCDPCGPPKISFPMKGDSAFSNCDVIYLDDDDTYTNFPLGEFPNLQPWSANQASMVIEQDFMVALEAYQPLPLNTPYQDLWAIGWVGSLTNGYPLFDLSQCYLVEEPGPEDVGMGLVKIKRRFAIIPPTRNEVEQFTYTYPGISGSRLSFTRTVQSRVQYDYFLLDDYGITALPVFPNGPVLNSTTGLYPVGLILKSQNYYAPVAGAVAFNNFLQSDSLILSDAGDVNPAATVPSATQWTQWLQGINTTVTNQQPEIIAEASTMRRWMGNIWERRTRFVQVQ